MHNKWILFLPASLLVSASYLSGQSVAISNDGILPHNSALPDVKSTIKGVLLPRMTQAQRNQIPNPATGLLIYQSDNWPGLHYYTASGWERVVSGSLPGCSMDYSFTQINGRGFESSSSQWSMVARFYFRGTQEKGIPTSAVGLVYTTGLTSYNRFRLYDVTNRFEVSTYGALNQGKSTEPTILFPNSFSNLSSVPAVYELQMLSTDNPENTGVSG